MLPGGPLLPFDPAIFVSPQMAGYPRVGPIPFMSDIVSPSFSDLADRG